MGKLLYYKNSDIAALNDISGLLVDMDASRGLSVDGSNNADAWTDQKSGLVFDGITTTRPVLDATAMNGRPALDFSGNKRMEEVSALLKGLTELTILYVIKPKTNFRVSSTVVPFGTILSLGRRDDVQLVYGGQSSFSAVETNTVSYFTGSTATKMVGTSQNEHGYHTTDSWVGGITTGNGTVFYRGNKPLNLDINGGSSTAATDFDPANYSLATDFILLGGWRNSVGATNADLNAYISEIVVYNKILSSQELNQAVLFLEKKWGVVSIKEADHIATYGQSNDVGQAQTSIASASYQDTIEGSYVFYNGQYSEYHTANFSDEQAIANTFGLDVKFSRDLYALTHVPVVFSKHATGGTSLASSWKPTPTYGAELATAVAEFASARSRMWGHGWNLTLRCIIWLQGEADAGNSTDAGNYQTNMGLLIDYFRSLYGPDFIFIAVQISVKNGSSTAPNVALVRNGTITAVHARPNAYIVNTDALNLWDGLLHFDTAGILSISDASLSAYLNRFDTVAV